MNKTILAWVCAIECPIEKVASRQLRYAVYTLTENKTIPPEYGLWNGIPEDSKNSCVEDICESIEELAREIKNGAEKCGFKRIDFVFDITNDVLSLMFEESGNPKRYDFYILERERPLNESERQEFLKQFALLAKQ